MKGYVVQFDRVKGFGFIRAEGMSQDVFVHISQIQNRRPLTPGQDVRFEVENTGKGPAAVRVAPGKKRMSPYKFYGSIAALLTAGLTAALIAGGVHGVVAYFISINSAAFFFYGFDKMISNSTQLRVPERILHGLALGGGSPAAMIGQKLFHHKTVKKSFQIVYWIIVFIQIALISAALVYGAA
ncbi:MAG: cold shock and DUF1294 domain-containing protein [Candidatus Omnitrophica bacterium]|nr:cold shock and DUF1294 domain-containing protein [Candidatus Omnitrophota bacterium]